MMDLLQCLEKHLKHNILFILFLTALIVPVAPVSGAGNNSITVRISPEKILQGDVAFIKVSPAKNIQSINCTHENRSLDFHHDKDGDFLISFLPIHMEEPSGKKKLSISITLSDGTESFQDISFQVIGKKFPTERLTLPESKVTLSKKNLQRYNREKSILEKVFHNATRQKLWRKPFIKPCAGKVGTPFGVKRYMNDKPKSPHSGIDLKADYGTSIASSSDGNVAYTGDFFFSGNSVFIDHGMGIFTMYFHLSDMVVKPGDAVKQGEVIGHAGSTGRSTGPHLHWGLRINNQKINPLSFISLFEGME